MRIAIYGISFPEGMAMTNRLKMYLKSLSEKETEIKVYSYGNKKETGKYEGVKFEKSIKKRIVQSQIDKYFLDIFLHVIPAWKITSKSDIIFISGFGWLTLIFICVVGKINQCKIVMELNENPGSIGTGILSPLWLRKTNRWFALNLSYRFIDGFLCISKPLEELAKKYKKNKAKTIVVPILCDCKDLKNTDSKESVDKEFPYIFHAGYISPQKDGIYAVIEAFALACSRTVLPLKFILTVRLAHKDVLNKIDDIIKENKLENRIIWLGFVSSEEVAKYRGKASMAIINKPKNWQNEFNFPTKLGESLSSGIPVIASRTGEMNRFLKDNITAYLVDPNNVEQIADRIIDIIENPRKSKIIGENGRDLAKIKFDYRNYTSSLHDFFSSI